MIRDVAIAGIGRTPISRESGRSTKAMAISAVRAAAVDAGVDIASIDGMACYGINDTTGSREVAYGAGIDDLSWALDLFGGGNVVITAIQAASAAIATGSCNTAVVYRSLNGRSGQRFGQGDTYLAKDDWQFTAPIGYGVPSQFTAAWAQRHQYEYGSTCEDLGAIAVTQRAHAGPNPEAIARDPLTLDEYLDSRWINEPLRLFDCTFEIDGACAILLTAADRARDLAQPAVHMDDSAVEWSGFGGSWEQAADFTEMWSAKVAPQLWSRSGLRAADIDIACIYDCFTYTVMAVMEDFGFAGKGEIGAFFREGRATYGGDVVVNPHGGLLSEGYLHGLNHHLEAVLQLRGQAGPRQVPDAETVLVTAGSGPYGGAIVYRPA